MSNCCPSSDGDRLVYADTALPVGTIIHNADCSEQSMVIHHGSEDQTKVRHVLALSYDLDGNRVSDRGSHVRVVHSASGTPSHHISETWWPIIPVIPEPTSYECDCNFCRWDRSEPCESRVSVPGNLCSSCDDHGPCGCSCPCTETVYSAHDICGDCEYRPLCEHCEEEHNSGSGDYPELCDSCGRVAKEEELEAEPLPTAGTDTTEESTS